MEKDTVLLAVEEYNELRDFKQKNDKCKKETNSNTIDKWYQRGIYFRYFAIGFMLAAILFSMFF